MCRTGPKIKLISPSFRAAPAQAYSRRVPYRHRSLMYRDHLCKKTLRWVLRSTFLEEFVLHFIFHQMKVHLFLFILLKIESARCRYSGIITEEDSTDLTNIKELA